TATSVPQHPYRNIRTATSVPQHPYRYIRTATSVDNKSSYELWFGHLPKLTSYHPFGCTAFAHVPAKYRTKLQPNGIKCIFLGFATNQAGFKLLDLDAQKVIVAKDVRFLDEDFIGRSMNTEYINDLPSSVKGVTRNSLSADIPIFHSETIDATNVDSETSAATNSNTATLLQNLGSTPPSALASPDIDFDASEFIPDSPVPVVVSSPLTESTVILSSNDSSSSSSSSSNDTPPLDSPITPPILLSDYQPSSDAASSDFTNSPGDPDLQFIGAVGMSMENSLCGGEQNLLISQLELKQELKPTYKVKDSCKRFKIQNTQINFSSSNTSEFVCGNGFVVEKAKDNYIPNTYKQAIASEMKDAWIEAMNEEMAAHEENKTWELTDLPKDKKALGCRWVFTKKDSGKLKARLVAQGFKQVEGIDYGETFSPVIRSESIKLLFALAAKTNKIINQMDVSTAFLNGFVEEELYMSTAPGYDVEGKVYKLVKSLYGLKQAPAAWNKSINAVLENDGFKRVTSELGLYVKGGTYLGLYVDDLIIAGDSQAEIDKVKSLLKSHFKMKDLGVPSKFLGMNVLVRKDGVIIISLEDYIDKMLEEFGMVDCNPVAIPTLNGLDLETTDENPKYCKPTDYRSIVGKLLYAANICRFDISYIVGVLSRHFQQPEERHYKAAKHVLRYLKRTKMYGLHYNKTEGLEVYTDADWGSTSRDRKSISGYIVKLAGAPISWKSKKQVTVALSTTEAEYMSMAETVKEVLWLLSVFNNTDIEIETPVVIYGDNASAITLANHPLSHPRTKHISLRYHFIRDHIMNGTISFQHISTNIMLADLLTKGLDRIRFARLLDTSGFKIKELLT
ncbi:hypothetical protein KGF54_005244, partial [Candida jiufengensis]|uniref:uncharacterized protein n=1 Tax=Candida jiufengensis TaxID=497108 RepID=UPI0022245BF8